MTDLQLRIRLISDTTFGRGDGVAGVVDQEIEHDPLTGLPFVKGRTVKGLLVEECANILFSAREMNSKGREILMASARKLFGQPGSTEDDQGCLHIGSATVPEDLRAYIHNQVVTEKRYTPQQILETLTTIRHQTAVNPVTNTPLDNTLRAMRVLVRDTVFIAPVVLRDDLNPADEALLAACGASVRRAGQSRSRGRGRIEMAVLGLEGDPLGYFADIVEGRV